VTCSGEHGALRAESILEHVADGVEGRVVGTRDDELRKRGRGQRCEWHVRLLGPSLRQCGPCALGERGRKLVRKSQRAAHERKEEGEVLARGRVPGTELLDGRDELVGRGIAGGSLTVSDRRAGPCAAASSETTPP
jgi:hypothetical protein